MRSSRVRRAHPLWVVETFFEREQESIFKLEEEAIFAELGHTFQGYKLAQKSRQEVQHTQQAVLYGLSSPYNIKSRHIN
jgi:hypothetical protein